MIFTFSLYAQEVGGIGPFAISASFSRTSLTNFCLFIAYVNANLIFLSLKSGFSRFHPIYV